MKAIDAAVISIGLSLLNLNSITVSASTQDEAITAVVQKYLPGVSGFGAVKAKETAVDHNRKTVTVEFNEAASYIPLTKERLESLKRECLSALGPEYKKYKVILKAGDRNLDSLVLYSPKKNIAPKEKKRFITREDAPAAPQGLDGSNIALWQSHGWYFEPKLNRWEWQRARIFETVEDLYTQSYVMPFLMPMLENAGAYVMSPRERDISTVELIIDNDNTPNTSGSYVEKGPWKDSGVPSFGYTKKVLQVGDNPFRSGSSRLAKATSDAEASWSCDIPEDGNYAVYISYPSLPNSTEEAKYTVHAADGEHHFNVNQKMGGGTWIYLGHFPLKSGQKTIVSLSGKDGRGVIGADAVKIGGGFGNVARIVSEPLEDINYEYVTSGYPRFTEGARYFLQWAGAPDSVYTPSDNVNDYGDDYKSRGLWVNWLTGGSSMLPSREGLKIPVDLSFAFHSDAGTTMNDSIIGTLGIYCTAGDKLGNGSDRSASRDYTDLVMTEIVEDVRATFEPNWTRRGMWDKSYFEARVPEVPAMLLELLSHQNFADMSYGLDPAFRFVVSRAVYKGMLKFLAHRDGRPYVVQPLPVRSFSISENTPGNYTLRWSERVDSLEETASPTYYIVQERIGSGAFVPVAKTAVPDYTVTISDNEIHSFRIIAANDGGASFPSEILSLCSVPDAKATVTIVNGFTRVSAPERFDAGDIAGFYDAYDHGVPYINDISFIGSQFEFRREIPWMDDDAPGFGASRADYEDKVIAGNTFDYVFIHGLAIREAGYSFISSSLEAFIEGSDSPTDVDLILGKQKEIKQGRGAFGTKFKAFPAGLQDRMSALAKQGTNFFVSGAYVASDLCANRYSSPETADADKSFASEILGFKWRSDQASVEGSVYMVPTIFKDFTSGEYTFNNTLSEECYAVESPDSFYPANPEKGCTIMRYSENNLIAGTALADGSRRCVVIGFPFETIKSESERASLMKQVLSFFSDATPFNNINR